MKLTTFLLLAVALQAAAKSNAQTVTYSAKSVSLEKVFTAIEQQTGHVFFYDEEDLSGLTAVSVSFKQTPLETALQQTLKGQPLKYTIQGKTIFITKIAVDDSEKKEEMLPPPVEITGRITNAQGEPMAGANVVLKRTGKGTIADANGRFTLKNVNNDDIIIISFIGYKTQNIKVGDRTNFTLIMDIADNKLDEMVVQAYGKTSQRLATGNISRITAEDISKQPVMNVMEVLQGQTPGALVTRLNGYSTGTVKIEVRGRNSINDFPSDPLYIIDGVPITILDLRNNDNYNSGSRGVIQSGIPSPAGGQSPFFSISPSDIESIEVLKDADATAIYGSRGANGVILINTKKGRAGKAKFTLNINTGFSDVNKRYPLMNTQQYVAMRREALTNDGLPIDASTAPDLAVWDTTAYTDWQDFLWNSTGKVVDINSSISGGVSNLNYRLSGNYRRQFDILNYSGKNERGGLSFNTNLKSLNQKLSVGLTSNLEISSANPIAIPGSPVMAPNSPGVFDKYGNLNFRGWDPMIGYFPFSSILQKYSSNTTFLNTGLNVSYELTKGLYFKTDVGYNNIQSQQINPQPIASQDPIFNPLASNSNGVTQVRNVIFEPQINYDVFAIGGKISTMIGYSYQHNKTYGIVANGFNISNDATINDLSSAPNRSISNVFREYKYAAAFGRVNYSFRDKYILNLNGRRDGSSRFGPGRQFGNFGSLGLAWIFTEESFLKNNSIISFGKIRASYGTTGSDQIGDYQFLTRWQFNQQVYNNTQILLPQSHTDSTLQWQVNKKLEVSLNVGLFNDKINFDVSWYRNRCNNQLVSFPTPFYTGFGFVLTNSPANVENKGWEFIVSSKIISKRTFEWTAKFNLALNRNKLLSYPNLENSPYANRYVIGKSLNIQRFLHYTGVDPQTGLYQFEDINGNGAIDIDYTTKTIDDRYIKDMNNRFDGGFSQNLKIKNWEIGIFFYFRKQYGTSAYSNLGIPGEILVNQPVEVFNNRWTRPGDIAKFAKFTTMPDDSYVNWRNNSDGVIVDASFIRLQNLSLSYSLPPKLFKSKGDSFCKLYVQGQNLFVITKYKGADPETQNFATMPIPRTIVAGISFTF